MLRFARNDDVEAPPRHSEPAEWIEPLELPDRRRGHAGAADAVKTVSVGGEVAIECVGDAILDPGYARVTAVEIMRLHVLSKPAPMRPST